MHNLRSCETGPAWLNGSVGVVPWQSWNRSHLQTHLVFIPFFFVRFFFCFFCCCCLFYAKFNGIITAAALLLDSVVVRRFNATLTAKVIS